MPDKFLVLADLTRFQQFNLLGRARRLFAPTDQIRWTDADGIPWAGVHVDGMGFAVSALGPNWCVDSFICHLHADKLAERKQLLQRGAAEVNKMLAAAVGALHLGSRCERVLWSIHREILRASRSVFRIPDIAIAHDVYGGNVVDWPPHWRTDLLAIMKGLTYLHVAEWNGEAPPAFGVDTALLTLVADLRRGNDSCGVGCPSHGDQKHNHFQVNVGKGWLGVLEELVSKDKGSGIRSYDFFRMSKKEGKTLRQMGKTGRLVSVFLPALLGQPEVCSNITYRQRDLLQMIVREATRALSNSMKTRKIPGELDVIQGNRLPNQSGKQVLHCPHLEKTKRYNGFNGNKLRRGLGYLLTSPGGWMAKAGYKQTGGTFKVNDLKSFVEDLAILSKWMGLTVVGLDPRSDSPWIDVDQLSALCNAHGVQQKIERLHLRIYAEIGWGNRWTTLYAGSDASPDEGSASFITQLRKLTITQRQLASELQVDSSLLSKLLRGIKSWPESIEDRARNFLNRQGNATLDLPVNLLPDPLAHLWTGTGPQDHPEPVSIREIAEKYMYRGWSIIPMMPNQKRPCVRWTRYQTRRPTTGDIELWYSQWPNAGIALVLGAFSGIFVIDVDGPEAHQALLRHLGDIPAAPLAVSGSRKPHRYHLYFRHPAIATKAKFTPWHPQLEFRGTGGLLVMPPSLHKSGNRYAWAPGRSLDEIALPEVPDAVLQALMPRAPSVAPIEPTAGVVTMPTSLSVEVAPSTQKFLEGAFADASGWNGRLFRAACDMHARGIPREEAEPLLLGGAKPWTPEEQEKALKTIASAYSEPRQPSRS